MEPECDTGPGAATLFGSGNRCEIRAHVWNLQTPSGR